VPTRAAALHFARAHPAITSLVAGAMSAGEVEENMAALRRPLPAGLWQELAASGLVARGTDLAAAHQPGQH
jgi:D-threo-aldose 1-dehydrogenase